jgi:hypothetical protein
MRVAGAAHDVAGTLRRARGLALAGGSTVEVRFDVAAGTVETRTRAGVTIDVRTLPVGVTLAALPARGRLFFTAVGTADNGTIRLAALSSSRSVVVNQRGRVRVQ